MYALHSPRPTLAKGPVRLGPVQASRLTTEGRRAMTSKTDKADERCLPHDLTSSPAESHPCQDPKCGFSDENPPPAGQFSNQQVVRSDQFGLVIVY